MAAFDTLQPTVWDGTTFPILDLSIRGGQRVASHEYPHADGGDPETLGRKLYIFTLTGLFTDDNPKYQDPKLYPDGLNAAIASCEAGLAKGLTLPNIGTVQAIATDWDRRLAPNSGARRSGEIVQFVFTEAPQTTLSIDVLFQSGAASISLKSDTLQAAAASAGLLAKLQGAFNDLQNAVNDVLAIKDQADVYSSILASKIDYLSSLCDTVDSLPQMGDASAAAVTNALHDLWASSVQLGKDVSDSGGQVLFYSTPKIMSVGEVSAALFQDTTHASDILLLNSFDDPLVIPKGFSVKYFSQ